MQFDPKLTLDGLMTLVGGALALLGVWLSNRRATQNLQKQLDGEKAAAKDEVEREKLGVARAVLFEVDGFFRYHLLGLKEALEQLDLDQIKCLPGIKPVEPFTFPVYAGNSSKLGWLQEETLRSIILFYVTAAAHLATVQQYRDYVRDLNRLAAESRGHSISGKVPWEVPARNLLRQLKDGVPEITKLIYLVCHHLCEVTGTGFGFPKIAVARENLSIEQIADELEALGPKDASSQSTNA